MANGAPDVAHLLAENERLEAAVVLLNDAVFGLADIYGRVLVEAGFIGREKLADMIEHLRAYRLRTITMNSSAPSPVRCA